MLLTAKALTNMDLPSCSFIENGDNAIAITEEGNVMDSEFSFVDAGIPYYFLGGLIIKNNVRIEAGVEMQMRAGSSIAVENSSALLTISGSQTNRVSISGKLNNAGFWKGIYLSSNQNHVFENLDISDGGSSAIGFNSQLANITLEFDAKLTMINCTSSRPNSSCDVLVHNFGGNPVFTDESDDLSVCTE